MNDMRLPSLDFPNHEAAHTHSSADSPRDPAQAFDAVMSRFSSARPAAPASSANSDTPAKTSHNEAPAQGKAPAGASTRGTQASSKPAAKTKGNDADNESNDDPTTAVAAADPTALVAVVTESNQLAAQNAAQVVVTNGVVATPAGKQAKAETSCAASPAEVLVGQGNPIAGHAGEKAQVSTADPAITKENDVAPVASSAGPNRHTPMTAKDTLRLDAPHTRTLEPGRAEIALRLAPVANAIAQATAPAASVPSPETAAQGIAAVVAGTNSNLATYSIAHAAVAAPLGASGFTNELAQRVVVFAGQKVQRAEIAVTPADLGPIAVSIEVRGQEATLAFAASNAQTRSAIEDALPRLRDMLAAQGLQLAGTHVGSEPRRDPYRPARSDKNVSVTDAARKSASPLSASPTTESRRPRHLIDIEV